jgi:hypothetical protein
MGKVLCLVSVLNFAMAIQGAALESPAVKKHQCNNCPTQVQVAFQTIDYEVAETIFVLENLSENSQFSLPLDWRKQLKSLEKRTFVEFPDCANCLDVKHVLGRRSELVEKADVHNRCFLHCGEALPILEELQLNADDLLSQLRTSNEDLSDFNTGISMTSFLHVHNELNESLAEVLADHSFIMNCKCSDTVTKVKSTLKTISDDFIAKIFKKNPEVKRIVNHCITCPADNYEMFKIMSELMLEMPNVSVPDHPPYVENGVDYYTNLNEFHRIKKSDYNQEVDRLQEITETLDLYVDLLQEFDCSLCNSCLKEMPKMYDQKKLILDRMARVLEKAEKIEE